MSPSRQVADHFSGHAADYAKYRPGYPLELFDWLAGIVPATDMAWDCGCGNGQATVALAGRFLKVVGTDLSAAQVAQAKSHPRVEYRAATAECSGLPDRSCDLVTVAQALHWFDFDAFYREVRRVLKPGGVLAAWTYTLLRADPELDALVADYHGRIVGPWWPAERRWVDDGYRSIPFPFADIATPPLEIRLDWAREDLVAYLRTWSASERRRKETGEDPTNLLRADLERLWPDPDLRRTIVWPIALRVGRMPKESQ